MRRLLLAVGFALPAGAALAQAPPPPGSGETLLTISETGSAHLPADRLRAELSLAANSPDAATAQRRLNERAQAALAVIRATAGVDATAGAYSVDQQQTPSADPAHPGPMLWHAVQTVSLSSRDGPAVLGLLGRLQAAGLIVDRLVWESAAAGREAARDAATRQALASLRAEADVVATSLGLTFERFRTVYLAPMASPSAPMPLMRMAAAPVAPLGAPDAGQVQMRASGTAILAKRP